LHAKAPSFADPAEKETEKQISGTKSRKMVTNSPEQGRRDPVPGKNSNFWNFQLHKTEWEF
jgi:hypothetical protein